MMSAYLSLIHAEVCHAGTLDPNSSFPLLQTQLLDESGVSLCSLPLLPTGLQRNNLWQATALYQNAQDCTASLGTAASLSFVSEAASGQSLCVDQIQLLPSSILQPGAVFEAGMQSALLALACNDITALSCL